MVAIVGMSFNQKSKQKLPNQPTNGIYINATKITRIVLLTLITSLQQDQLLQFNENMFTYPQFNIFPATSKTRAQNPSKDIDSLRYAHNSDFIQINFTKNIQKTNHFLFLPRYSIHISTTKTFNYHEKIHPLL